MRRVPICLKMTGEQSVVIDSVIVGVCVDIVYVCV